MIPEQTISLHFANDDITLLSEISQAVPISTKSLLIITIWQIFNEQERRIHLQE